MKNPNLFKPVAFVSLIIIALSVFVFSNAYSVGAEREFRSKETGRDRREISKLPPRPLDLRPEKMTEKGFGSRSLIPLPKDESANGLLPGLRGMTEKGGERSSKGRLKAAVESSRLAYQKNRASKIPTRAEAAVDTWLTMITENANVANGKAEFETYDPSTFSLPKAKKRLASLLKNEEGVVTFETITGADEVLDALKSNGFDTMDDRAISCIERMQRQGLIRAILLRHISDLPSGATLSYYYFDVYLEFRAPDGKLVGKLLELHYDGSD